MRPAIAQHRISYVLKLLKGGMSQRQASINSGVSLPIVNEIARGERGSAHKTGEVKFQDVEQYTCPGCKRPVTTAPCVACTAKRTDETTTAEATVRPEAETAGRSDTREVSKRNPRRSQHRSGVPSDRLPS
jgi:hypothetical protein